MSSAGSSNSDGSHDNSSARSGWEKFTSPWRLLGFGLVVAATLLLLPLTDPVEESANGLTAQFAVRSQMSAVEEKARGLGATEEQPLTVAIGWDGPEATLPRLISQVDASEWLSVDPEAPFRFRVAVDTAPEGRVIGVTGTLVPPDAPPIEAFEVQRRTGGWEAILPPLIAVVFALFFHRLLLALGSAVWLGAALQTGFDPVAATQMFVGTYLWGNLTDSFNLYIIAFTLALVGMVHVIVRMGGIAGVLEALTWLASTTRSTRVTCVLLGFVLFFDDYANTVVVGSTMRPLTDDKRISREKLAYIVDSTSAPVAGLAVISTWIGYEVGLFEELSRQIQMGMGGYEIFFQILPLRFYCLFTLVFVVMIAVSGRDFGPMLSAERRARQKGQVRRPGSTALQGAGDGKTEPKPEIPHRWYNAVIPVTLVIVATIGGMYWSGWRGPASVPAIPGGVELLTGQATFGQFIEAWGAALGDVLSWEAWTGALEHADNAKVLFWASIAGSATALGLAVAQDLLDAPEAVRAWSSAIPMMGMAVGILILAWSIQAVCDDLGTSIYLVGTVQHLVSPRMLPLLVFGLAAVVAFATGTSWGTMGILLPAMIPLAHHMTAEIQYGSVLLLMCFGAVLDGAIFGDHCSPISDTTVMSSIASGVDHIDHVRTQIPYAMTSMSVSALFGYAGVALGLPLWAAFLLGIATLAIVVWMFGAEPEAETSGAV